MFDFIFNMFEAWNQLGLLAVGVVFSLIGGGLAGYEIAWRLRAKRIKGVITEVRVKNTKSTLNRNAPSRKKEEEEKQDEETISEMFEKEPVATSIGGFVVLLFVGLPLLFSGMGVYMGYSYLSLTQTGKYAEATVIRNDSSYDSDNGTSYKAVLRFSDARGRSWEVKDTISYGSSPSFSTGTKIGVYYDPKDPNEFVIDDFWHNMAIAIIFTLFGFVFIGFIFLGLYLNQKKESGKTVDLSGGGKQNFYNEMYRAVFEYKMPNGDRNQIVSDISSNSLLNKIPGTRITLLMSQKNPENVKRPSNIMLIFGIIFLVPGIFILHMAVTNFKVNIVTVLMVLAAIGFITYKIWSFIKTIPVEDFKKGLSDIKKEGIEVASSYSRGSKDERSLDKSEIMARIKVQARNSMVSGYVMIVVALGLAGGAYFTGLNMIDMTQNGIYTIGKVVDIKSRYSSSSGSSSSGYTYHAIVSYADKNSQPIRFEDSVGSSNPIYKNGDQVDVLYLPDDPQGAIIDRGLLNWGLSGGLALGALLILLLALKSIELAQRYGGARYRSRM